MNNAIIKPSYPCPRCNGVLADAILREVSSDPAELAHRLAHAYGDLALVARPADLVDALENFLKWYARIPLSQGKRHLPEIPHGMELDECLRQARRVLKLKAHLTP